MSNVRPMTYRLLWKAASGVSALLALIAGMLPVVFLLDLAVALLGWAEPGDVVAPEHTAMPLSASITGALATSLIAYLFCRLTGYSNDSAAKHS